MLSVAKRLHSSSRFQIRCFTMSCSDKQSYQEAVTALNSLQSNAADVERARRRPVVDKSSALGDFERFMNRTGITVGDLSRMSVIHVSGTKGKGSTCALVESILKEHGIKTGFFSSPHLVEVRERIRLNGQPLTYSQFAEYFWQCYNRLVETKTEDDSSLPAYFRFLNLMTFHVFLQEKVDVAIVEVGIGGRYDTTNIVPPPVVCGIASLGYDHTALLGKTLKEIAWHKAGIMKPGTVAFTAPQAEEGMASLAEEAKKVQVHLEVCPPLEHYPPPALEVGLAGDHQHVNASLALQLCRAWMQRTGRDALLDSSQATSPSNSGARPMTEGHVTAAPSTESSSDEGVSSAAEQLSVPVASPFAITPMMRQGLSRVRWPGRCDVVRLPRVTIYLDGAHTVRSSLACSKWFKTVADSETREKNGSTCRVMVFNATGGRDPESLLSPLMELGIDAAAFCPNVTVTGPGTPVDMTNRMVTADGVMSACMRNRDAWSSLHGSTAGAVDASLADGAAGGGSPIAVLPCVRDSLAWLCQHHDDKFKAVAPAAALLRGRTLPPSLLAADHVQVLVVGSLHLVGTALAVLRDCCGIDPTHRA